MRRVGWFHYELFACSLAFRSAGCPRKWCGVPAEMRLLITTTAWRSALTSAWGSWCISAFKWSHFALDCDRRGGSVVVWGVRNFCMGVGRVGRAGRRTRWQGLPRASNPQTFFRDGIFFRIRKMFGICACLNLEVLSVPEGLVHSIGILEAPGVFLAHPWLKC